METAPGFLDPILNVVAIKEVYLRRLTDLIIHLFSKIKVD